MSTAVDTQQATGVWQDDGVHTNVRYEIEHNGVSGYRGSFEGVTASLEYNENGVKIKGEVDLGSVDLKDEQQKGHVLSPDFFDYERHPKATYESNSVEIDGTDVVVNGDLTLRGVTKPVTVRGQISAPSANIAGGETIAANLTGEINRQDFGVAWSADLPNGNAVLGDEVTIEVYLELVKA